MFHVILGALLGYVAGVFTPGVARKLKALFVRESQKGGSLGDGEIAAAKKDIQNEAKKL